MGRIQWTGLGTSTFFGLLLYFTKWWAEEKGLITPGTANILLYLAIGCGICVVIFCVWGFWPRADYTKRKDLERLKRIKTNLIHFRRELNWFLYFYTHDLFGNLEGKLKGHEVLEGEEFKSDMSAFDDIYGYYDWEWGYAIRKYDVVQIIYPFEMKRIQTNFANALVVLNKVENQIRGFPTLLELNDDISRIVQLPSEINKCSILLDEWSANKNIDDAVIRYYANGLITLGTKTWGILKAINNEIQKIS